MLEINVLARFLLLPPAGPLFLILFGLLLWRAWPRLGRAVAVTGLAVLIVLSTNAGASFLIAPLERMTTPLLAPEDAGAQAIVVLSAGRLQDAPEYGGRDIPDYYALARLRYAAHLQRRTGLDILASGGIGAGEPRMGGTPLALGDAMASALREDFGVPVRWVERESRTTFDNAEFSADLLRRDGVKRILLVTDAMHMARSRAVFERAGLEVVDAPTMFFNDQARSPGAWLPSAEGMRRSWYASYELLGLAWYRLRGQSGA